jgi:hypothetical protein
VLVEHDKKIKVPKRYDFPPIDPSCQKRIAYLTAIKVFINPSIGSNLDGIQSPAYVRYGMAGAFLSSGCSSVSGRLQTDRPKVSASADFD